MRATSNSSWHGRPISWGHSAAEEDTRRREVGGIKPGYSGHVPRGREHYGTSHLGGLPCPDVAKRALQKEPVYPQKRSLPQKGVNHTSATEVGRQAWTVEWSGHAQLLKLLRPQELKKYDLSKSRDYGTGKGARDLEAGANLLESITGLDLDGDGDVGARGSTNGRGNAPRRQATPPPSFRGAAPAQASFRGSQPSERSQPPTPLPSYRRSHFVPISRSHRCPSRELHRNRIGGIKPYYLGHIPNNQDNYGVTPYGGVCNEPDRYTSEWHTGLSA